MRKLWCQLWNAFLNAFRDAVTVITEAAIQISRAVITIFTEVVDAIGSTLTNNPLFWVVGIGLLLWFIPKSDDKKRSSSSIGGSGPREDYYHDSQKRETTSLADTISVGSNGSIKSYDA